MSPEQAAAAGGMPAGYVAVAVRPEDAAAPLQVCVAVRRAPDPAGGSLVVLRETLDARVLLGCLADAAGHVHEWLELWIQDAAALAGSAPAVRETLTNAVLDERWQRQVAALGDADGGALLRLGAESEHPPATFIDLSTMTAVHAADPKTGQPWRLCTDEGLLAKKGLPGYGTSLHRYLHVPELGADSPLAAVRADSPAGAGTIPLDKCLPAGGKCLPLNPGGGFMFVRRHRPIALEPFIDILSGGKWEGLVHGKSPLPITPAVEALANKDAAAWSDGRLFLALHGRTGRLVETLHLKLKLLLDVLSAVRAAVQRDQRPLLNISADSFRVDVAAAGAGLPFLWTARPELVDPGDALALPIPSADATYYLRGGAGGVTVYGSMAVGSALSGRGLIRIRQVLPQSGGLTALEGTLSTQERLSMGKKDLLWLRVNVAGKGVELYARLDPERPVPGQTRFRTIPQRLGEEPAAALKRAEGAQLPDAVFELVPMLSTPCDLYSLAVLAVRTLLVNEQTTLPVALDEMLALAGQVASEHDQTTPLFQRIGAIFARDEHWPAALGAQRLTCEPLTPAEAFALAPEELWHQVLALIVRMFPGLGPDSSCQDYSDAAPGGLHKVFDKALEDLRLLLVRTRSLIVIDWQYNREVHAAIGSVLEETTATGGQSRGEEPRTKD